MNNTYDFYLVEDNGFIRYTFYAPKPGQEPREVGTVILDLERERLHVAWKGYVSFSLAHKILAYAAHVLSQYPVRTVLSDGTQLSGDPYKIREEYRERFRHQAASGAFKAAAYVRSHHLLTAIEQENYVSFLQENGANARLFGTVEEAEAWLDTF